MLADEELFRDPDNAAAELERRLAQSLRVEDGVLLVLDPVVGDLDLAAMPATAFWVLHCGMGITVAFGGGGTHEAGVADPDDGGGYATGSADSSVEIYLTTGMLDAKTCASIMPRLTGKIRAILRQR